MRLFPGVFDQVTGLGSEPDKQSVTLHGSDSLKDIGIPGKPQGEFKLCSFLYFVFHNISRCKIGHRGSHDQPVRFLQDLFDLGQHLPGSGYLLHIGSRRNGKFDRSGNNRHLSPTPRCSRCHGVSHTSRRSVTDEAHGIDRLPRGAGCNEHSDAGQVPAPETRSDLIQDIRRLRQSARAHFPACQFTLTGGHHMSASLDQGFKVLFYRRMSPHP